MTDAEYLHYLETHHPDTFRRVIWMREMNGIKTINRLRKEGYEGEELLIEAINADVPLSAIRLADL